MHHRMVQTAADRAVGGFRRRSPIVSDGFGRRAEILVHPDFRYGRTVLLVQLVDVRQRGLDKVRQNGIGGRSGRLGGADRGNKQRWRY